MPCCFSQYWLFTIRDYVSSQNSIWEAEREKLGSLGTASPTAQVLIIMSGGVVTPQSDSGSYWPIRITWPAVSSLIGRRQTTCGLSPSSLQTVLRIWSPWRCNYASLIVSQVTSWPLPLTSGHCSMMSVYSPHKCPLSTDPKALLSPPAARPESPCAPRVPHSSPLSPVAADNNNTKLTCCCTTQPGELGVHHCPGSSH